MEFWDFWGFFDLRPKKELCFKNFVPEGKRQEKIFET